MSSSDLPVLRIMPFVARSRWAIPLTLSALGIAYTVWENLIVRANAVTAAGTIVGFALLGVIGPLLTFLTLTWTWRVQQSLEQAERARERRHQQLVTLNAIGKAVNQSLDLDTVLEAALNQVLDTLHLESGEVRLIENGHLRLCSSRGVSPEFVAAEQNIPLGYCVCGQSAQRGELIAVEPLNPPSEWRQTLCACERFSSVLAVPVRTTERVVGVIHVASRTPRSFDAEDRMLLAATGQQVGVAIEKAQLHAQLKMFSEDALRANAELEARVTERTRELVEAKEELARKADALRQVLAEDHRVEEKTRARIAHDLHDGVQQLIIGALYETQAARDSLARQPETAASRLITARDLLRRVEEEMRRTIYSLRPLALDAHGLVPALRECAASFERAAQVKCTLRVEGTPRRLEPDAEVAVFRIVQEALNNVEAHAQAQRVTICLCFGARELEVQVADDGVGFDVNQVTQQARTHLGLIGMQERAENIGGTLQISSRVGEGTHVILDVRN